MNKLVLLIYVSRVRDQSIQREDNSRAFSNLGYNLMWASLWVMWKRGDFFLFFLISHRLSVVGLRPSSSLSTGCVVSLRGEWAIFCHAGSGRVGRVRSAREKSLEILRRGYMGIEPGPRGGQTESYPTELSWLTKTRLGRLNSKLSGHWPLTALAYASLVDQGHPWRTNEADACANSSSL